MAKNKYIISIFIAALLAAIALLSVFRSDKRVTMISADEFFGETIEQRENDSSVQLTQIEVKSYSGSYRLIIGRVSSDLIDQWAAENDYR